MEVERADGAGIDVVSVGSHLMVRLIRGDRETHQRCVGHMPREGHFVARPTPGVVTTAGIVR